MRSSTSRGHTEAPGPLTENCFSARWYASRECLPQRSNEKQIHKIKRAAKAIAIMAGRITAVRPSTNNCVPSPPAFWFGLRATDNQFPASIREQGVRSESRTITPRTRYQEPEHRKAAEDIPTIFGS